MPACNLRLVVRCYSMTLPVCRSMAFSVLRGSYSFDLSKKKKKRLTMMVDETLRISRISLEAVCLERRSPDNEIKRGNGTTVYRPILEIGHRLGTDQLIIDILHSTQFHLHLPWRSIESTFALFFSICLSHEFFKRDRFFRHHTFSESSPIARARSHACATGLVCARMRAPPPLRARMRAPPPWCARMYTRLFFLSSVPRMRVSIEFAAVRRASEAETARDYYEYKMTLLWHLLSVSDPVCVTHITFSRASVESLGMALSSW